MSRFPARPYPSREPLHRRNGKIRAREVRVIDEAKLPLGVMTLGDALKLAQTRGLDLIEIAPNAVPPVWPTDGHPHVTVTTLLALCELLGIAVPD